MKKLSIFLCAILLSVGFCHGQKTINLDDCIKIALENNFQIKRAENNVRISKSNRIQALMNYLPDLNASANWNVIFGTTFDQNSGNFVTATTRRSSPSIGSSLTVFNGFANTYRYKQSRHQEESSRHLLESSYLDTKTSVLGAYLNVLLDREQVKIAEIRIELLTSQLDREIKRETVGVGNMESVFNFKSQVANEKLNLVNLQNNFKADKLRLIQLMGLNSGEDYNIEEFELSESQFGEQTQPFGQILNTALTYSPAIKSSESDLKASRFGLKAAHSNLLPTISAYGELGSGFSSNNEGNFSDQLDRNRYDLVNFSLNIPIFNRFQNMNRIQVAKLNMYNAEITKNETEQNVRNNIQQVYLDLVAAQETYKAAIENLKALDQSFTFVNKRYEEGMTDFFTYLESLNNKNRAEIELANAKYSIVFRKKILDLLQGL